MSDLVHPTSPTWLPLPADRNYSKAVLMRCTRGTAEFFNLWSLPAPASWTYWPADGGRMLAGRRAAQQAGKGYRIAYAAPESNRGYRLARFCLEKGHTQHPLKALCDHLDSVSDDWLWLTDENGARLNERLFFSISNQLAA